MTNNQNQSKPLQLDVNANLMRWAVCLAISLALMTVIYSLTLQNLTRESGENLGALQDAVDKIKSVNNSIAYSHFSASLNGRLGGLVRFGIQEN